MLNVNNSLHGNVSSNKEISGSGIAKKGDTGNGIDRIEKTSSVGLVDTYTIYFTNGTTTTYTVNNGEKGDTGEQGEPGHTPVKGVDYFTQNEIDQIIEDASYDDTQVKSDISSLQSNKADKSEIPDVSNFITRNVNNLTNYTLKTSTGSLIDLEINDTTYVVTLKLKDIDGNIISTDTIDLPLETVVVSGRYDNTTKKVILTLENGSTVEFSVADLVSGLQSEITSSNKLASDLVDDSNSGNKFVTTSEKATWNGKQDALIPGTGIDITNNVISNTQTSAEWGNIIGTLSDQIDLNNALAGKQPNLVSGTNIKTINNNSILGSGNINIEENEVFIGNEEDAPEDTKIIINDEGQPLFSSEVVNSLSGNETAKAPSVKAVNDKIEELTTYSTTEQVVGSYEKTDGKIVPVYQKVLKTTFAGYTAENYFEQNTGFLNTYTILETQSVIHRIEQGISNVIGSAYNVALVSNLSKIRYYSSGDLFTGSATTTFKTTIRYIKEID